MVTYNIAPLCNRNDARHRALFQCTAKEPWLFCLRASEYMKTRRKARSGEALYYCAGVEVLQVRWKRKTSVEFHWSVTFRKIENMTTNYAHLATLLVVWALLNGSDGSCSVGHPLPSPGTGPNLQLHSRRKRCKSARNP